jgi:hypothetical protein
LCLPCPCRPLSFHCQHWSPSLLPPVAASALVLIREHQAKVSQHWGLFFLSHWDFAVFCRRGQGSVCLRLQFISTVCLGPCAFESWGRLHLHSV